MNAREELIKLVWLAGSFESSEIEIVEATDAILAAGYRKLRVITTSAELDAAVEAAFEEAGHLVLSDRHGRPWIIWGDEDGDAWADSWPQEEDPERLTIEGISLPAKVLYEPEVTL